MNSTFVFSKSLRAATKIAFLYFGISLLWLCFSDQAILLLFKDVAALTSAQTYKGLLFVAASTGVLFLLFVREIRRYEQTEAALRTNEQYLDSIFRAVPTGIGVVRNRVFLTVNDRICSITGYTRNELIGQNIRMLYADDSEYERVGTERYHQLSEHGTGTVETRWQHKDGQQVDVLLSSTPLHPQDLSEGETFTALDITERKRAETALRESEERFSKAFKSNPAPMVITEIDSGRFIDANQRWLELIGYAEEEIIGKTSKEINIWNDSGEQDRMAKELFTKGRISEYPVTLRTKFGETRFTLSSVEKITINGQEALLSIILDCTERHKTEKALRESEEKFALAFEASPDSVNINRLEDGLYVEINKGFTDLTGYTREDVIGRTSVEINIWHDPADRQRMIDFLKQQGYCENFEAMFRRKDGTLAPALMSARTISLHNVPHLISITRDITQRQKDETDLKRLKVAIEHASEVIVITDAEGHIQYANPAFEKVTGYTIEDAFQQNPRFLKSGMHTDTFYSELWETISSGRTWNGRLVNKKKDGTIYTEEATISPVFDSQRRIVNYVAIKRDITEHLKLEAQYLQAQKMESVGRLTGGVAHDFNNILAVILGYTEMALAQTDASQKLHTYLERIYDAANRSADIVRQLLAFSRNQTIAPKVLDLNETVEGMLKMLHRLIGEDIDLVWLPAPDLAPIKMDPVQIDQILANLCVNAQDAIKGAGTVTIETKRVRLDEDACAANTDFIPGEYVMLAVSDTGCGMDKNITEQIFEPFFTTKGQLGTGLGLATVYGIVKQNNSFIKVASEPDKGTTIRIYLPIHEEGPIWRATKKLAQPHMSQGETILLVEDDPTILELSCSMLERLGYRVLATDSPSEALRLAAEQSDQIDLLITDVVMPEINGKELSQRLLAQHPKLKLIYISGYTADVIANHGVLDEGVNFLQKPFSISELSTKIKEVLDTNQ